MRDKPKILNSETLAQSRLFQIESLHLAFSNGVEAHYERLVSTNPYGAVLVVPMLDDDTVLLIREYAAGVHRYELTLPKGKVDAGETILEAANRELMEEVGHAATELEALTQLTLAPGYLNHSTHIVLARGLYPQQGEGDEPEPLEVVPWSLSQLDRLLACEDCTEARTIAALFMVRERLQHGQ